MENERWVLMIRNSDGSWVAVPGSYPSKEAAEAAVDRRATNVGVPYYIVFPTFLNNN